jgi:signal peptidase I
MSAISRPASARRSLDLGGRRVLRIADRAASGVCGLAVLALVALLVGLGLGYRPLIDHSGSMAPAIGVGDVVITHGEPASSVRPGQIVSFSDQALQGRLVTHRVVAARFAGARIDVVTRGDANAAGESWSVARSASVGHVVFRIPAIGLAMAWISDVWVRTALLTLVALVLSVALLRRIWRS